MAEARLDSAPIITSCHCRALAILALFVFLAAVYSVVNPILESPDEIAHYGYIEHLVRERGLPIQRPGEETAYEQEGSQPPLYYVVGATLISGLKVQDTVSELYRNPYVQTGIGLARENQNALVHSEAEAWPWRGLSLAVHLLRVYSILLGAATVWGVWHLGRTLFPGQPVIALGGMALTAFNPMFVYLSSSINNDNLIICISAWMLVQCSQAILAGPTRRRSLQIGAMAGLGALTKVSGLLLFPIGVTAILLATLVAGRHGAHERQYLWRTCLAWCASLAAIGALIASWWYARNILLYGELTGTETMLAIFGTRQAPANWSHILSELKGFRMTYWGLFGSFNVALSPGWAYVLLEMMYVLGLGGAIRWIALRARQHEQHSPMQSPAGFWASLALLLLWAIGLHLSLLRWTSLTYASQARLIFPALGALSLLVAWGLSAWFPPRLWGKVIATAIAIQAMVAIAAPWTTIVPAYRPPDTLTVEQIPESAIGFHTRYGNAIELVAYELEDRSLKPGESTMISLYWHALAPVESDYSVYLHLFGREGEMIAFRDSLAGMALYPSSRWEPGEVIKDAYELRISPDATGPVAARLNAGLYTRPAMERLPVSDGLGREVLQPTLGYIKIEGAGYATEADYGLDYTIGDGVRLTGYDLGESRIAAGQNLQLTLYWETAPLDDAYTIFVHLVSADGTLIGQDDGPPLDGEYPTTFWGQGERIAGRHEIQVKSDAPLGEASILVGMYRADGQRLPVSLNGHPAGDSALITTVAVSEP